MISELQIGSLVVFKDLVNLSKQPKEWVPAWTGLVLDMTESNAIVFWGKQKVWSHEKEDLAAV